MKLFEFSCAGLRYALRLDSVERVEAAAAITPLPGAPPIIAGIINLHGEIVPVIDFRRRIGVDPTPLLPSHRFLITRTARRRLCLIVDETPGLLAEDALSSLQLTDLPKAPLVEGMLALADGLAVICDLDAFLSLDEQSTLDSALAGGTA